jgi:hypothetical protein
MERRLHPAINLILVVRPVTEVAASGCLVALRCVPGAARVLVVGDRAGLDHVDRVLAVPVAPRGLLREKGQAGLDANRVHVTQPCRLGARLRLRETIRDERDREHSRHEGDPDRFAHSPPFGKRC